MKDFKLNISIGILIIILLILILIKQYSNKTFIENLESYDTNKLFVWLKTGFRSMKTYPIQSMINQGYTDKIPMVVRDITYYDGYIYGTDSNYRIWKLRYNDNGGISNWLYVTYAWAQSMVITNGYIYFIGRGGWKALWGRKLDLSNRWHIIARNKKIRKIITDDKYIYGLGYDSQVYYIEWNKTNEGWILYRPGYMKNISFWKWGWGGFFGFIIGVGFDGFMYMLPGGSMLNGIPPPPEHQSCAMYNKTPNGMGGYYSTVWVYCGNTPTVKWGIGPEGQYAAIGNCNYAVSQNRFNRCPVDYPNNWDKLDQAPFDTFKSLQIEVQLRPPEEHAPGQPPFEYYFLGTDRNIWKTKINTTEKKFEIIPFIQGLEVKKFLIVKNHIYAIGLDNLLYIHPLVNYYSNNNTNEGFSNYISQSNYMMPVSL